jgi:hypothetical protein
MRQGDKREAEVSSTRPKSLGVVFKSHVTISVSRERAGARICDVLHL